MPHALARRCHAVTLLSASHLARRCVAAAGIAAVCAAAHTAAGAQVAQQFYLTVLDRDGVPIHDLQPGDVTVTENGVPGRVTHLVRPTAAADVFLLVDTSRSFVSATPHLRRALLAFVDRLAGSARMSLMVFGGTPRTVVSPGMRTAEMRAAIALLFPSPGFNNSFQNALIEARRRVVEESPRRPGHRRGYFVGREPAAVGPLRQGLPEPADGRSVRPCTSWRCADGRATCSAVSPRLAARTGGRFATVANHTRLEEPLAAIAEEILAQYVLTYIRPELPADTDAIGIGLSIAREEVTVRVTPVF